jgi:glycine/D-amino acid oxidase-like deaminating enzyme
MAKEKAMSSGPKVIVVGAGILGLASAYHLLRGSPGLDLLIIDRLPGPGRGNTARSAAAFRDLFSSPVNRALSQGSIAFYEKIQKSGTPIGLQKIGYLWLMTAAQLEQSRTVLAAMATAGVRFETLQRGDLTARIANLNPGDLAAGIFGKNCGILNPNLLAGFYAREILRLGGRCTYGLEVTGLLRDGRGAINGVRAGGQEIPGQTVLVAAGAWMSATLARGNLEVQVAPRKRQLFGISAREGGLDRLLHTRGFSVHELLPLTIMPGGAYLRPASGAFVLGYANADQPAGLEEPPQAEPDFYENRIRPQVEPYLPAFQHAAPAYSWAGHYADYLRDSTPVVARLGGVLIVGGDSGSGIMKADALGRTAAALYAGREEVVLGDGGHFRVASVGLTDRKIPAEEFII